MHTGTVTEPTVDGLDQVSARLGNSARVIEARVCVSVQVTAEVTYPCMRGDDRSDVSVQVTAAETTD